MELTPGTVNLAKNLWLGISWVIGENLPHYLANYYNYLTPINKYIYQPSLENLLFAIDINKVQGIRDLLGPKWDI